MGKVAIVEFTDYQRSVTEALDAIGAGTAISGQPKLLLKPNIINAQPPPVTTPVECVEAVLDFCRANSTAEILIGDGCGGLDTLDACEQLGYGELARRKDVRLVDLDREDTVLLENPSLEFLPKFHMPKCVMDCYLMSIPVLKAHSMADVTLSLKSMV